MSKTIEILKFKLVNGEVAPEKIRVSDLGRLLSNYEKALIGIISVQKGGIIENRDYHLSLIDINNGSAEYINLAESPSNDFQPALQEFGRLIKGGNSTTINPRTIDGVNHITGWLRTHNCDVECYYSNNLITTISKELRLGKKVSTVKEETTIYGKVNDVGKDNPRIEIRLEDSRILTIHVKHDEAIELGKVLYRTIAMHGISSINPETYYIESFELKDFDIINDVTYEEKFKNLGKLIGKTWDQIPDHDSYLNESDGQ